MSPTAPEIESKALELFFVVDVSGSMAADGKIQSLNTAVEEALPFLRQAVAETVGVRAFVRLLAYATDTRWVVDHPVPIDDFLWPQMDAEQGGLSELGVALGELAQVLETHDLELPPALILLSDGMPSDTSSPSFTEALALLDSVPVARAASRVAIAVGEDADDSALHAFVAAGHGDVLSARNPQQLATHIRTAGSTALRSASEPIW